MALGLKDTSGAIFYILHFRENWLLGEKKEDPS